MNVRSGWPDPLRAGAYTASNNALSGRGSGHKRLVPSHLNSIRTMNFWILSLYIPIDRWIHCPTEELPACTKLCVVSHALLFDVLSFGVQNGFGAENGSFIDNWISINCFTFGQSVGWKVRKYLLILFVNVAS